MKCAHLVNNCCATNFYSYNLRRTRLNVWISSHKKAVSYIMIDMVLMQFRMLRDYTCKSNQKLSVHSTDQAFS